MHARWSEPTSQLLCLKCCAATLAYWNGAQIGHKRSIHSPPLIFFSLRPDRFRGGFLQQGMRWRSLTHSLATEFLWHYGVALSQPNAWNCLLPEKNHWTKPCSIIENCTMCSYHECSA